MDEEKSAAIAAAVTQVMEDILTGKKAIVVRHHGSIEVNPHDREDRILNMETTFHIVEVK